MKFLALSSLLGLSFLSQETQAATGFDDYMNDLFSNNKAFIENNLWGSTASNQGFQTLVNSFGLFGSSSQSSYQSNNLKSQPEKPVRYTVPQISYPPNVPGNPLARLNPQTWNIFDCQERFCKKPRVWDGSVCSCPNNAPYISGKCYNQPPKQPKLDDLLALRYINRNYDGTENNKNNPLWGSKSADLLRLCPANYEDGKSKMWSHMPKPRDVSNLVGEIQGPVKQSKLGLNMLFNIWGQFTDHDITLSPTNDEPMNIEIPRCDKYMDKKCTGNESFPQSRSIFNPSSQVRANINVLTSWIDASQVYGSDKATADSLRQFKNGKLKSSDGNLLPKDQTGGFFAGDFRVNQNVALTVFQTIFMREHNRICDQVLKKNPNLNDEQVFHIARNYVIGLVEHITFDEYLPALLGKAQFDALIGDYKYDPTVSPNIYTEFSAAAFRLGHPLINAPFKLMDNFGNLLDSLDLGEMFFNPSILNNDSLNQFINGLARTGAKQRSLQLVNDLRNFLFFPPNAEVKLDLYSFNIQRGRDHGVCSVKDARQKLGLSNKQFKDLFEDQYKAKQLQKLYHDTDNLDLWLGIIGQKSENGSVLGEMGIRLNAYQFKNIRNGDKYWYQNVYPDSIINEIKNTSFADVLKRNSGVKYLNSWTFKKL